jgi:Holliday junction resolvasome RuvABC DNA-binding subunit
MKTEASLALAQMGFTKHEARVAVDEAANALPPGSSLEQLLRAALRLTKR